MHTKCNEKCDTVLYFLFMQTACSSVVGSLAKWKSLDNEKKCEARSTFQWLPKERENKRWRLLDIPIAREDTRQRPNHSLSSAISGLSGLSGLSRLSGDIGAEGL